MWQSSFFEYSELNFVFIIHIHSSEMPNTPNFYMVDNPILIENADIINQDAYTHNLYTLNGKMTRHLISHRSILFRHTFVS